MLSLTISPQGDTMDADAKKIALRMIPYGIYVLTADDGKGNVGAATVNWVTQGSFAPPLVVVGVKADSGAHTVVEGPGGSPSICCARITRISPSPASNRPWPRAASCPVRRSTLGPMARRSWTTRSPRSSAQYCG